MNRIAVLAATIAAIILICLAAPAVIIGATVAACAPATISSTSASADRAALERTWDAEQTAHAATIVAVGVARHRPYRGWVIAVATAVQESGLRNLGHLGEANDHDSLGLFQQRPNQGWGTPEQLMDPEYAAGRFYDKLITVAGWQIMPLTQAAQAVQVSAYPDAYAKHEAAASVLVGQIAAANRWPVPDDAGQCTMGEWTQPVHAPIVSGFRTPQRPNHLGVDLGAGRGTPIKAASFGQVIQVRCNAIDRRDGSDWGCDRDGDPNVTAGCGYYVELLHPGNVMTRYCHTNELPSVNIGDKVVTGQPIGIVGSTGHSSGPHLHFEIWINTDANGDRGIPVDPVPYMQDRSAPFDEPD